MWLRKCMIKKTSWISDLLVFKRQCICSSLNHIKAKVWLSCEDYISKGTRLDLKAKPPSLSFVPHIQVSTFILVQTYQYHYQPFRCLLLRLFRFFSRLFSCCSFSYRKSPSQVQKITANNQQQNSDRQESFGIHRAYCSSSLPGVLLRRMNLKLS